MGLLCLEKYLNNDLGNDFRGFPITTFMICPSQFDASFIPSTTSTTTYNR